MTPKPYTARSIEGAQRRVRELVKLQASTSALLERYAKERNMMAKAAASGPCFTNPLEAMAAQTVRDQILAELGYSPDGSPKDVHR